MTELSPASGSSAGSSKAGQRAVVTDNAERQQYEVTLEELPVGLAAYRISGATMTFTHTEVDPAMEGQGIGGALATFGLDDARRRNLTVVPSCSFIRSYIDRHPNYRDLLDS